ncbi:MAG: hypothetical protein JWM95_4386 [Gemmatimonadetes bacterium]|nr:hypothetical protein [Gemmatimonadota bacterium]
MKRDWGALVFFAVAGCSGAAGGVPAAPVAAAGGDINAAELRHDLYVFAADSMRGRETGTPDALNAAAFLAARVQRLGLEPAGDSLYIQRVPLQRESLSPSSRITVEEKGRTTQIRIGVDVAPLINLGTGIPPAKRTADGEIVFVGYGLVTGKPKRDDLAGLDLEGKVVVVVNGAPKGADAATIEAMEAPESISERLARILPQHPAAVVILLAGRGMSLFEEALPQIQGGMTLRSEGVEVPESDRPIPMILLGVPRAKSPLLPADWPVDDRPQVLKGRHFSAHVSQERTLLSGYNVVAVLRGSDPALSKTYVALGAHYDHLGIVPPVSGDSIANGADDDGSGSVALLAIARAMATAQARPKRSMLFVWHTGEEEGLFGSSYFVDHSTVPMDSIVAQLNADMVGRNAPPVLYTVGPLSAPNGQSKRLGAIVDSVNAASALPFVIDKSWDSPTHPEHIYERSDHFNYARKGVPIVFFTTGMHPDYHRATDEASKIEYDKLARVARLIRDVAVVVGNGGRTR